MRSLLFTTFLGLFSTVTNARSDPIAIADAYFERQVPIATENLLANIGPDGARSSGALPGVVIASPSTEDPDYLYTWTRDASLVMKNVIDRYLRDEDDSLQSIVEDFIPAQAYLQQLDNPSGNVTTGGLGEPKFNIDLTPFTGSWGRPQRDGPPLRAIAIIRYANHLLDTGKPFVVLEFVWPVIKLDLDYTAKYWNTTGFDLWEEVSSSSFFTSAIQHRALMEGAAFASRIGQPDLARSYFKQADNILCFLQSYWNPSEGFITSNTGGGRTGIDANSILGSIHTFDPAAGCDPVTFQPCSDKALSNLKVYVDAFRSIYPINYGTPTNQAVATGRYAEDVYYGGHPWYLTTAAAAQQLYDALMVWDMQGYLKVSSISLAFFRQFDDSVQPGTYSNSSETYRILKNAVRWFADEFIEVIARYTPEDGSLAEQFHRETGEPLSAKHLTWSYASILTADAARSGVIPRSWGASGLEVPSKCESNAVPMSSVTFSVKAQTSWGENIFLTGSIDALKNWSPDNALALSSSDYPIWKVTVEIPVDTRFEYKYIRKLGDGSVIWESDPNRSNSSPGSGSKTIDDSWR
ncbi:glucoamylase [Coprinopsis cinerea AmutBmut pab1-1]|nr:glucoamylase [Coprinopsis cinerea AmutBmut pab1-1]